MLVTPAEPSNPERWPVPQPSRCTAPVLDAKRRATLCGKPATAERTVEGVALPFCDDCAAAYDAKGKSEELHPWPTGGGGG